MISSLDGATHVNGLSGGLGRRRIVLPFVPFARWRTSSLSPRHRIGSTTPSDHTGDRGARAAWST
jgi:hypothetical protein